MLFNSFEFLVFYIIVTFLFFALPNRIRWLILVIASCYFYASFIPIYLLIIFLTIIIDYFAGIFIEKTEGSTRKFLLILSIISNVSILAFFKYYNFFVENVNFILTKIDFTNPIPLLNVILPIGLSFHTFQAMSYTIEVFRGNQKAEKHFGIYALYVLFYPQLVAGPIERPQNIIHQFREFKRFNWENLFLGTRLMLWGLFKKTVIADRVSIFVDRVFDDPTSYNSATLLVGTIFFAIQIYCDFSGYSDIAIGAARTMGFNLMTNFNRPYFATNIKNFWERWHISLSTWFRDYVYIPLGGNRVKTKRLYFNVAVVFLLSGFWHGASWTFIIWGGLHVLYFWINMFIGKTVGWDRFYKLKYFPPIAWFVTFSLVCLAWIFFRADSIELSVEYFKALLFNWDMGFNVIIPPAGPTLGFGITSFTIAIFTLLILIFVEKTFRPRMEERLSFSKDLLFLSIITVLVITLGVFEKNNFIYFQF